MRCFGCVALRRDSLLVSATVAAIKSAALRDLQERGARYARRVCSSRAGASRTGSRALAGAEIAFAARRSSPPFPVGAQRPWLT